MKYGSLFLAFVMTAGVLATACDDGDTSPTDTGGTDARGDAADVVTEVVDDTAPDETDTVEVAPTLTLTGTIGTEATIDAPADTYYFVLLVPDDFENADGFDDPGLPSETIALFIIPMAAGYDGADIELAGDLGLFYEPDLESPTMLGDPWEAETGTYRVSFALLQAFNITHLHLEPIEVTEVPSVIDVGDITLRSLGTPPPSSCTYTHGITFVDESVDGSEPCGESDGTCISGTVTFFNQTITIADGDVGEAYLFGDPSGPPLFIFEQTNPSTAMPYRIPNIPAAATDACTEFQVGGRLDVGGDHHGMPGGPEDPVLAPLLRIPITLEAGDQIDGLDFTVF